LAEHPETGTLREDLRPNLRVFSPRKPAHNYLVFFYPIDDGIEVNTVVHGARDYPSLLGQRST
jgi:toxin ParE1/3/4